MSLHGRWQLSTPDWIGRFSGRIAERPKCSCVVMSVDNHRSVMLTMAVMTYHMVDQGVLIGRLFL
jgi:hypothetical protein